MAHVVANITVQAHAHVVVIITSQPRFFVNVLEPPQLKRSHRAELRNWAQ